MFFNIDKYKNLGLKYIFCSFFVFDAQEQSNTQKGQIKSKLKVLCPIISQQTELHVHALVSIVSFF